MDEFIEMACSVHRFKGPDENYIEMVRLAAINLSRPRALRLGIGNLVSVQTDSRLLGHLAQII